ncbi:MAG: cytochrome c [Verrucomicrobia bacterium]|nr:cytochrome c [Verrucomicrobiota bacterium]
MRYFLSIFIMLLVFVIGVAGFRGSTTRRPPIELFPDMDRQPKLRPQAEDGFFGDGRGSRLPVAGTIARSTPLRVPAAGGQSTVYSYQDVPVNTGRATGMTNFIENIPLQVTGELVMRGMDRYQINCLPCHGSLGDGNGVTRKFGMAVVANLHDPRLIKMGDGELFHVITSGRNLMSNYAAQVSIKDRWAIIAYVRALQRSRVASVNDVPEQLRSTLKN